MVASDTRYDRDIRLDSGDSFSKIVGKIPPKSTLLDIGCGPGVIGAYVSRKLDCTVDGVDVSEEFCRRARETYRDVWLLDIQNDNLRDVVGERTYDRIICADVLEHLSQPELVLGRLPEFLSDQGRILISIPNVTYLGVVTELACGRFEYRDNGLLDRTHLRFFTRSSLIDMLTESGLRIFSFDTVNLGMGETEFDTGVLDQMDPSLYRALVERPDALTYQFVVEVAPGPVEGNRCLVPAEVQTKSALYVSGYENSLHAAKENHAALEQSFNRKSKRYEAHLRELEEEVSKQSAEVELRGVELERKRSQLKDLRAEVDLLRNELGSKTRELNSKEDIIKTCVSEKENAETALRGVYSSRSWRIAEALRGVVRRSP